MLHVCVLVPLHICVSSEVCWFYLSCGRAPPIYAPAYYYIVCTCVLILLPNAAESTCSTCTGSTSLVASNICVHSISVFFTHPTAERRRKYVLEVRWFYLSCGAPRLWRAPLAGMPVFVPLY